MPKQRLQQAKLKIAEKRSGDLEMTASKSRKAMLARAKTWHRPF